MQSRRNTDIFMREEKDIHIYSAESGIWGIFSPSYPASWFAGFTPRALPMGAAPGGFQTFFSEVLVARAYIFVPPNKA